MNPQSKMSSLKDKIFGEVETKKQTKTKKKTKDKVKGQSSGKDKKSKDKKICPFRSSPDVEYIKALLSSIDPTSIL